VECVKAFRILLNTEPGFMTIVQNQAIISKIAFCLYTTNDKLRTTVAEVLAAICVISGEIGHRVVMAAFGDFKGFFNERHRFEFLVESLIGVDQLPSPGSFSDDRNPVAANDYKTMVMSLINALVTTPESLEIRLQLREEFHKRGLTSGQLVKLRFHAPVALITQIDLYEEEMREDFKEAEQTLGLKKAMMWYVSSIIMSSPTICFLATPLKLRVS